MTPPSWGIPVILVVGSLLVAAAWWWDRRHSRGTADSHLTEHELPDGPLPSTITPTELDALLAARHDLSPLPLALADAAFLTHPNAGVAVAVDPLVLVTDADLIDERFVLPALGSARAQGRALVLASPRFSAEVLGTLRANAATGRITTLPLVTTDPDATRTAAETTGALVVTHADLQSGWLPAECWGAASAVVADARQAWIRGGESG